jgi:phosphopantothenoylcysteine decarboxylase / phosphopantothenate---cysteine ligase
VVRKIPKVALAITGGISVYKIAEVVRLVKKANIDVQIVATASALNFVGAATWSALSGSQVISSLWDQPENVSHVQIAKEADLVVIAPATADTISDLANAKANSAVSALALTTTAPIFMFPAMHTQMWEHVGTQENIKKLSQRGLQIFYPERGSLTSGDEGIGRLVSPEDIANIIINHFDNQAKPRLLITSGGTKEFIDPVRFIGNMSSGKQGLALAQQSVSRGWDTTLISTNDLNGRFRLIKVVSAKDMLQAVMNEQLKWDILIMAAAISDWSITDTNPKKLKKNNKELQLELSPTVDILTEISKVRLANQVVVGFAAETIEDPIEMIRVARQKLLNKKLDFICANNVSDGKIFAQDETHIQIIDVNTHVDLGASSKLSAAAKILDKSVELWRSKQ